MPEQEPLTTALHDAHAALEAKIAEEGGWRMPVSFRGPIEEAREVRRRAGAFDLSNIGRIRIRGDEALDLVERVCTAEVVRQEDNTARYTLLCNEAGGIIDHCLAVRLEDFWLLTTSPGCRLKVLEHLRSHAENFDVRIDDQTPKTAIVAVAGPAAEGILDEVLPVRVADLPAGGVKTGSLMVARYIALRTAYLGQWTLEVILTNMLARKAWRFITNKAGQNAVAPAGFAARDILRIEAGRCRYGHELNESIDPFTAGLEAAVDFEHEFVGRQALAKLRDKAPARKRVGLVLGGGDGEGQPAAIPRLGTVVSSTTGKEVGAVTSGTVSPALDRTVAMAYVATDAAAAGTELLVGQSDPTPAEVVELPLCR